MKFVIPRDKWRCGAASLFEASCRGKGDVELLNDQGYRCCLGHVAQQLGAPDEDLLSVGHPSESQMSHELLVTVDSAGEKINSDLAEKAITINDSSFISQKDRESLLKELFAEHGHEIKFYGAFPEDEEDGDV